MTQKDKRKTDLSYLPIWLMMLGPVLLLASMIITAMLDFRFMHMEVSWKAVLLGLLPTIVLAILHVVRLFVKVCYRVFVAFALLGLLYFIPIGMLFTALSMDFYSETEDIAHYRQLDELFYWNETEEALFPAQAGENGRYYYYCNYDNEQVLYAEWTLPPEELAAEIERAEVILSTLDRYRKMQHGGYTCLIAKGRVLPDFEPFQEGGHGYHPVTMFAYNPQTGVVRYILSDRTDSDGLPYYMTLDWQ